MALPREDRRHNRIFDGREAVSGFLADVVLLIFVALPPSAHDPGTQWYQRHCMDQGLIAILLETLSSWKISSKPIQL